MEYKEDSLLLRELEMSGMYRDACQQIFRVLDINDKLSCMDIVLHVGRT